MIYSATSFCFKTVNQVADVRAFISITGSLKTVLCYNVVHVYCVGFSVG